MTATLTQTASTLHETDRNLDEPGGNFALERTMHVERRDTFGNLRGEWKVRLVVRVDVYHPMQSEYRAEVWSRLSWHEVVRVFGADPDWLGPERASLEAKREFALDRAANLLGRALDVLS